MQDIINAYISFILGLITFITPLIISVLYLFKQAQTKHNQDATEQLNTVMDSTSQILSNPQAAPEEKRAAVRVADKKADSIESNSKKELRLLNPKRQLIRINIYLIASLLLALFDCLVRDDYHGLYNHNLSMILLLTSFISFVFGSYAIIQVTMKIWEATYKILVNK